MIMWLRYYNGISICGFFFNCKKIFFKKPPVKTAAKQTLCSSVFKYIWFQIPNNYSHWIKVDSNPIGAALQVSIGQRLTQNTKKTPQNSHTKFFLVSFFLSRLAETSYHWKKKKLAWPSKCNKITGEHDQWMYVCMITLDYKSFKLKS